MGRPAAYVPYQRTHVYKQHCHILPRPFSANRGTFHIESKLHGQRLTGSQHQWQISEEQKEGHTHQI